VEKGDQRATPGEERNKENSKFGRTEALTFRGRRGRSNDEKRNTFRVTISGRIRDEARRKDIKSAKKKLVTKKVINRGRNRLGGKICRERSWG